MSGYNQELWKRNRPVLQTDFLVREKILPILGDVEGLIVLDAGCGEGYVSRKLAKAGAIVEGFDKDPKMITFAEELGTNNNRIVYRVGELLRVDELYPSNGFDVLVLSGVICDLNEEQLSEAFAKLYKVLKPNGRILVATNHTDSYFQEGKSKWLEYLSKPNISSATQEVTMHFNNADEEHLFTGVCYFHTPEQVSKSLKMSGFEIIDMQAPLATDDDTQHFTHMWGDEKRVPYHLILVGRKD